MFGGFENISFLCTRKSKLSVPWMSGLVSGLQNRVRRFESARNLKKLIVIFSKINIRNIRMVPWMSGLVSGLQNRVRQFESARHLPKKTKWYYIGTTIKRQTLLPLLVIESVFLSLFMIFIIGHSENLLTLKTRCPVLP